MIKFFLKLLETFFIRTKLGVDTILWEDLL